MKAPKTINRLNRRRRVCATVHGTLQRPRCTVYRSLTQINVQLIDDETGATLVSASTTELKKKPNVEGATELGSLLAKKAKEKKITEIAFDRNGYKYHGRIKAFADAARDGGLKF